MGKYLKAGNLETSKIVKNLKHDKKPEKRKNYSNFKKWKLPQKSEFGGNRDKRENSGN